ncbi:MAG: hypothetical protein HY843_06080 [Bdellovibrio sp.]|nr:hypothetical protein [Bdellovibrio sp.]
MLYFTIAMGANENNVISLGMVRKIKNTEVEEEAYRVMIISMSKTELLDEMVRFQEERTKIGKLTLSMMVRGKHLFKALEEQAETLELKTLTGAYRRHLEYEIAELLKRGSPAPT